MDDTTALIADALDQVGPRLKHLRQQRGVTLTALAASTGISKSTLSRLETGQRRPSLELLLPLAHAYRVPLDELVGAPEVGDPRVRLKPRRVNGRTVISLTRSPGGVQAWKIVIPADQSEPHPRVHPPRAEPDPRVADVGRTDEVVQRHAVRLREREQQLQAGTALAVLQPGQGALCLLYTSPSPRDGLLSRMPSSA